MMNRRNLLLSAAFLTAAMAAPALAAEEPKLPRRWLILKTRLSVSSPGTSQARTCFPRSTGLSPSNRSRF